MAQPFNLRFLAMQTFHRDRKTLAAHEIAGMGQSLPKRAIRATSALPLKATELRIWRHVSRVSINGSWSSARMI